MWLFAMLLTVLFVGLKLGGVIAWSWLWVVSPIVAAIGITVAVFGGIGGLMWWAYKDDS